MVIIPPQIYLTRQNKSGNTIFPYLEYGVVFGLIGVRPNIIVNMLPLSTGHGYRWSP